MHARTVIGVAVFTLAGVTATAHSARERSRAKQQAQTLATMEARIEVKTKDNRKAAPKLNGTQLGFELATADQDVAAAAGEEVERCRRDQGAGELPSSDHRPVGVGTLIHREDHGGESTVLCKLGNVTRLTWIRPVDAKQSSLTTLTTPSWVDESLFPSDRDAPGTDIPGVPRPVDARRIATLENGDYGVRIYALKERTVEQAVASLDAQLTSAGLVAARVVSSDARLYVIPGAREQLVASFTSVGDEIRVAMVRVEL